MVAERGREAKCRIVTIMNVNIGMSTLGAHGDAVRRMIYLNYHVNTKRYRRTVEVICNMGNLIKKDDLGNWGVKGLTWEKLYVGQVITREVHEKLYGCLYKLMQYEDTGLTPEQVEKLIDANRII